VRLAVGRFHGGRPLMAVHAFMDWVIGRKTL
jgi:hypothetical protein